MAKKKVTKKIKLKRKSPKAKKPKNKGKVKVLKKKVRPQEQKPSPAWVMPRTKIKVIGIGGGGGSIVSEIASGIKKIDFWAANTDLRALKELSKKVKRFHFGQELTQGLGTGMSVELGKLAAEQEKEKIKKLLQGSDFCVIVASLGGGTGSGAASVFAKVSQSLGNITYGIFTLPFKFEGEKKMEIARESLQKLKPNLNALSVVPNEKIFQIINKETPLKEALSAINRQLAESLRSLIQIIYEPGLINIDFADLRTIMKGRGRLTYLNTIEAQGTERVQEAIKKLISSPLYPYSIRGAKGILLDIAGEKDLGLTEVEQISRNISELANKEAKIIFGVSPIKSLKNKIKITLLATGCATKIFPAEPKPEKPAKSKPAVKRSPKKRKKTPIKAKPRRKIKRKPESPKKIQKTPIVPPKEIPDKETSDKKVLPQIKPGKKIKKEVSKPAEKISKSLKKSVKSSKNKSPVSKFSPGRKLGDRAKIKTFLSLKKPSEKKATLSISSSLKENREEKNGAKVRKDAVQIKKEIEEQEQELLSREKFWETPAFLRKQKEENR